MTQAQPERGPINPPGTEKTYERWHFASMYRVGDTIHVSGVIGAGADGRVPDDPETEFANAFATLRERLEFAGSGLADIVEMTTFHVDMGATLATFMAARDAVMSEPWPAWTAIGCTELALPGGRAEVKATAVLRS